MLHQLGPTRHRDAQKRNPLLTSPKKATTSPSKKQPEKTASLLPDSYLEILGSETPIVNTNREVQEGEDDIAQMILDKQKTLTRAMKAATDGDSEEASYLFRLHSKMIIPQAKKLSDVNSKEISNSIVEKSQAKPQVEIAIKTSNEHEEKPFVENGITFMPGHVPSTTTSLLTPYFDKNIKEFKGPIPLSIFDLGWQALADNYHAEKKVKTDDVKHNNYTGYPYPDDLTLDYGSWCINYRNFLKTFANPYGWHTFAKWGAVHKENVEAIRDASGWMVALRYDVKIRDSAFRMKCSDGVTEGTPDIRKRRKDIEEDCYAEARRFNELGYGCENPYAKGGDRADWNPRNGQPKQSQQRYNNQRNSSSFQSHGSYSNQQSNSNARGAYSGRGSTRGGRSGYRGPPELYDPNFAEKRAAAAAKSKTVPL